MAMEDDGVDPLQTPVVQAPVPVTPISSTSSDTSGDGRTLSSTAECQRLQYTMEMDLILLRQLRSHPHPFVRGSNAMEKVALELAAQDASRFSFVNKKGVRDRAMKLLDHHCKGDAWKKPQ